MKRLNSWLHRRWFLIVFALAVFAVFYLSLPKKLIYDYTIRVANVLLGGELGLSYKPPPHVGEFVPFNGYYYSVFPLGAVLSFIPYVLVSEIFNFSTILYTYYICIVVTLVVTFFFLIALHYGYKRSQAALIALVPVFGSWVYANSCLFGCGA